MFPEIRGFADHIYTVVYEADESCIAEIERQWATRHAKVLPLCLAEARRDAPFFLNVCPFTSSMFPFNRAYGDFYQEMRAQYSDYLYAANCAPRQELIVKTTSIDALFAAGDIPRVDFLSLDTQGAELSILRGGATMLEHETVGVSCEVSFADLYQNAPLFGDLDGFLRDKGFLLASLSTIPCGYKRIARRFRGPGMPRKERRCISCVLSGSSTRMRRPGSAVCRIWPSAPWPSATLNWRSTPSNVPTRSACSRAIPSRRSWFDSISRSPARPCCRPCGTRFRRSTKLQAEPMRDPRCCRFGCGGGWLVIRGSWAATSGAS